MDVTEEAAHARLVELTAELVVAYVTHNPIPRDNLPELIGNVHAALNSVGSSPEPAVEEPQKPAVSLKQAVQPDYVVCLEDGLRFKAIKRHLRTAHGMTPEEYRKRWDLPSTHPMVAPNYAAQRSKLAKEAGLGRKTEAKPKTRRK